MKNMLVKITLGEKEVHYEFKGVDNEDDIIAEKLGCEVDQLHSAHFELLCCNLEFIGTINEDDISHMQRLINENDLDLKIIDRSLDGGYLIDVQEIEDIVRNGYWAHIEVDTLNEAVMELAKERYKYEIEEMPNELKKHLNWHGVGEDYAREVLVSQSSINKYNWFVIDRNR